MESLVQVTHYSNQVARAPKEPERKDLESKGPKDLKNDKGLVNFFKDFTWTPPPKNGYVRLKKVIPEKKSHFLVYCHLQT